MLLASALLASFLSCLAYGVLRIMVNSDAHLLWLGLRLIARIIGCSGYISLLHQLPGSWLYQL